MSSQDGPAGARPRDPRWRQLCGLRCIAMIGVFYVHFWNAAPMIEHVRVSLFFVVSGFLITSILLRARDDGLRSLATARNFYIRRALRLMPALIIALGVAAWFDMAQIRDSLPFHLLQMTDLYVSLTAEPGQWKPWIVTHLWSLNVLERFYLLWPLVVLMLPMPAVVTVTVIAAMLPPLLRINLDALGLRPMFYVTFSWAPIAWGALLALFVRRAPPAAVRALTGPQPLTFLLLAAISLGAAALTRVLVERPLEALRPRFPTRAPAAERQGIGPAALPMAGAEPGAGPDAEREPVTPTPA